MNILHGYKLVRLPYLLTLRSGSSGLRSGSNGGLRIGSRETLEVTNWHYARVVHNVNYIIQRITKNSSGRFVFIL